MRLMHCQSLFIAARLNQHNMQKKKKSESYICNWTDHAFSLLDALNKKNVIYVCVCQAVEEFLAELRCREQSQNADLVSQMTAVKFLIARKFDVSRAIDLFQAYKVQ